MKIFGTDGVRGPVNRPPITPDILVRLGRAIGREAATAGGRPSVFVGRDTRRSGAMVEAALTAGLLSAGVDVIRAGALPTAAVGWLTQRRGARLGIMVTASHNPFTDNGLKVFGADGYKIDDALQARIEAAMDDDPAAVGADQVGEVFDDSSAELDYVSALQTGAPEGLSLAGLSLVLDCANGAASAIAPDVIASFGADVRPIHAAPDGLNINQACGANHPEALIDAVRAQGVDLGAAFDGDADRLILVDEGGAVLDGDQILAALARASIARGDLRGGGVVSTIMANLGFEHWLAAQGLTLARTPVGDRHVAACMRDGGFSLGGEPSGHVIAGAHATTGDGLASLIGALAVLKDHGGAASEALRVFDPTPQIMVNVRYEGGDPLDAEFVVAAITAAEAELGRSGRLVIRKSGTEPLIRIMVEAGDGGLAKALAERLADVVRSAAAAC